MTALVMLLAVRASVGAAFPPMLLYHVNFQEEQNVRLYDSQGRMQKSEVRRLQSLLRCHHSGKRHRIDSRLMQLLYRVSRHYDGRRIEIVSGYRDRRFAKTRHSAHTEGRAVDFQVAGVTHEVLRDFLRTFPNVGVGFYPNSSFVHLDVRDHNAFWIDYSGPGESAKYSEDPQRELQIERILRAGTR